MEAGGTRWPAQGGGRRVSRGRLPGDDDALPPRRRGTSSGEYPAAPDYPDSGGTGAYPGDSRRSDAAVAGPAWTSPGRSVWEPDPGPGSTAATGYPATDYPGTDYPGGQYPDGGYPDGGHAASDYPAGDYPVPGGASPAPYAGTEYAGPDYPDPGDYPSRRTHVARGREPADEPGESDW